MAKMAPIPTSIKGTTRIFWIFGLRETIYFLVSVTIAGFMLRMFDSFLVGLMIGAFEVVIVTALGFFKWPHGSKTMPSGMRLDEIIFNLLRKKWLHKAVYTRSFDFEKNYEAVRGKSRVVKKELY